MSLKAKIVAWTLMLALTASVISLPFLYWSGLLFWEGGYPLDAAIVWWVNFGTAMGFFWYLAFKKS